MNTMTEGIDTIILVAHMYRDQHDEEVIRLISARKAIASQGRAYAENQRRQR